MITRVLSLLVQLYTLDSYYFDGRRIRPSDDL
jgi:hypothetical protein